MRWWARQTNQQEAPKPTAPRTFRRAAAGRNVSRVLCLLFPACNGAGEMVIYLGWPSPATSSSLPAAWRCGPHLAAYLALLRLGVTLPPLLPVVRWALTPPFHPYPDIGRTLDPGGFFSVALSVALRRPGVTWQPTLWSSDFPRTPCGTRDHRVRPVD